MTPESSIFRLEPVIAALRQRRPIFVSEADFQLELAWIIKEQHPAAKVRLEYCPEFAPNLHLDILVVIDGQWIPIELKYKTKGCRKTVDGEVFNLKNHSANDVNCYLYLKDLQRIEYIRDQAPEFLEGYTIFITNDLSYARKPLKENCAYHQFSLEDGTLKTGVLDWSASAGEGTKRHCQNPIALQNNYLLKWREYSHLDDTKTGTFLYLANKIAKR